MVQYFNKGKGFEQSPIYHWKEILDSNPSELRFIIQETDVDMP